MGLLDLVKEAYSDVAPIFAQGSVLLHYKIPGDGEINALKAEQTALQKSVVTLKGYANQLLKSGDASVKSQQDALRADVAAILGNAQDALKMIAASISGIQQIQNQTKAGNDVSINDTSQIMTLKYQADQLYQNSMSEIAGAVEQIKAFFSQVVVKPAQVGPAQIVQTIGGVTSDAAKLGATAAQGFGNATIQAAKSVPGAVTGTGKLLEYLPWIVGGVVLIGGILYVVNLPKPRDFSFGD